LIRKQSESNPENLKIQGSEKRQPNMTAWPIVRRRSVESISIFLGGIAAMAKIDRCAFFLAAGDVIRTPGRSGNVTFVIMPGVQQRK